MNYNVEIANLAIINALLALAAYLPLTTGSVVVCFGAAMALGAVAAGSIIQSAVPNVGLALLCAALTGGVFMLLVGLAVRRLSGFLLSVTTLAVAGLLQVLASNLPVLGGALGYHIPWTGVSIWWSVSVLLFVVIVLTSFERTLLRKAIALTRYNPVAGLALGVNNTSLRAILMGIGGGIAGIAGGLYVFDVGIVETSTYGFVVGIQIATFAIVGGTRSYLGALAAGLALTVIPELLRISHDQRTLFYGAVLMTAVLLRPEGQFQWKRR